MPSPLSDRAPFVTFYSYKGGVGRSMAVLNVAALLAARGFRVLIIDFDLEAPGLTHLCGNGGKKTKSKSLKEGPPGVVELLSDAKANGDTSSLLAKPFADIAADYTFELPIPAELKPDQDGRLFIMPAGRTDADYATRFDDLDLADLYQQGVGRGLMLHFKKVIAECGLYDYVIVDSRTGHSDEAGICTRDLPTHLMIVSGFNRQNIAGTASFLRNLRAALGAESHKRSPDIILSPVPIGEEDLLAVQEKTAREEFKGAWGKRLSLELSIPYHPRLALTEDAYVTTRTTSYLKTAYSDIEARMLVSLGHEPHSLYRKVAGAIKDGKGSVALAALGRALKLRRSTARRPQAAMGNSWYYALGFEDNEAFLDQLLRLPEASEVVSLLAMHSGSSYDLDRLGRLLHRRNAVEASIIDEALLATSPSEPEVLADYAVFLHNLDKKSPTTKFYERAIDSNPKDTNTLGNYAVFLQYVINDSDSAETFYKRAVDVNPSDARNVANYAHFLDRSRKDRKAAKNIFQRAIDVDPTDADNLGNFANFLKAVREDHDKAEEFFKRALDVDPKHAINLGNYADFLKSVREDHDKAEELYKRAIAADPKSPNYHCDYGQLLLGAGRKLQGLEQLREAWQHRQADQTGNCAELAYSLWLGSCLAQSEEHAWEQVFKSFIETGIKRHPWSFDAILAQAKETLSPSVFKYANALASAFLDDSKVAVLKKFPRWKKLIALDPARVNSDGSVRDV